jgi:hypothetical protein
MGTISLSCFALTLRVCFRDGNYVSFLLCADFNRDGQESGPKEISLLLLSDKACADLFDPL